MSRRRAINRIERRQLHQELHLVRRGMEDEPNIYTEDDLNAARREVIDSISDRRYRTLARDIMLLTDDCDELDERVDDVRRILMSTTALLRSAVSGIHDGQRRMRTKLNTLTTVVNAIAKSMRNQASSFGDLTRSRLVESIASEESQTRTTATRGDA